MKYYVRFTLKDTNTQEQKIMESEKYENLEQVINIMEDYLKKQTPKSLDIKLLGNNRARVEKFGGYILVEIVEEK